jgi:hypothetical protein
MEAPAVTGDDSAERWKRRDNERQLVAVRRPALFGLHRHFVPKERIGIEKTVRRNS